MSVLTRHISLKSITPVRRLGHPLHLGSLSRSITVSQSVRYVNTLQVVIVSGLELLGVRDLRVLTLPVNNTPPWH